MIDFVSIKTFKIEILIPLFVRQYIFGDTALWERYDSANKQKVRSAKCL